MKDSFKQLDFKVLGRVLGFISGKDRAMFIGVLLCQIINALVMVKVSTFVGVMIDDHILPMLASGSADFAPLLADILRLCVVMVVGLLATFLSGQMLALVTQSAQKKLRDTMFSHMQTLPIKYFDTHAFGDVMSTYTNDTDTLRMLISQTIPNVFSSLFTIVTVFITMVSMSIPMTGFVLLTDDGNFAHDILAPKRHGAKTYVVRIDTPLTQAMIDGFAAGVTLADGSLMQPAALSGFEGDPTLTRVVLTQGVYHQIKRMFGTFGAGVVSLRRVAIGALALDETLGAGGWRELTPDEVALLQEKPVN